VPTGAGDKPVTPLILQSVRILRRGAAAQAFDPAGVTPALPVVAPATATLGLAGGKLTLGYPVSAEPRLYHVFFGPDLARWQMQRFTTGPLDATVLLGQPGMFFQVMTGGYEP
jgi:hypothetical protein